MRCLGAVLHLSPSEGAAKEAGRAVGPPPGGCGAGSAGPPSRRAARKSTEVAGAEFMAAPRAAGLRGATAERFEQPKAHPKAQPA